jgi:ATP-dependent Clp protease ATP-binding subunit ClpC
MDQAAAKLRLATPRPVDAETLREQLKAAVEAEDYEKAAWIKQRLSETGDNAEAASTGVVVDETAIAAVVAARTGIPVGELVAGELQRLAELEDDLHQRVVGQDEAVEKVADTIRRARVGLSEPDRPLGSFLFLGPTGVGKTELVKALAERLFATEDSLVRIDMSEYREPHTVARLVGSPPGYVGYGDGGQLTEPVRRRPYSVILLDEIEKAHPEVWNVLLQLLDDGRLTDGEGRTVDFTNAVIVMTSNLGAGRAKRSLGFTAAAAPEADDRMLQAAKQAFLPEFLNRIDEVVTFKALGGDQVERIARLIVDRVAQRLHQERRITLTVDDALVAKLAADGFDEEFGARPLQRHVRRTLERELTRAILSGSLTEGAQVRAPRPARTAAWRWRSAPPPCRRPPPPPRSSRRRSERPRASFPDEARGRQRGHERVGGSAWRPTSRPTACESSPKRAARRARSSACSSTSTRASSPRLLRGRPRSARSSTRPRGRSGISTASPTTSEPR